MGKSRKRCVEVKQIIALKINGSTYEIAAEPSDTLLEMVRQLGFKGTKELCGHGECGTCMIIIEGTPVLACLTLAVDAQGKEITFFRKRDERISVVEK